MGPRSGFAAPSLASVGGLLVLLLRSVGSASGDSWPAAQINEVVSQSREWFVRVVPGMRVGETYGFAGPPKGSTRAPNFTGAPPTGRIGW